MKGNIFLGTAQGRMGDVVAKIRHGKQIISKYQPQINNPKSPKQMGVRDLFAKAIKFTKEALFDGFITNMYAIPSGTAKNMFVNINRLAINTGNALKGAIGYLSKLSIPLMQKTINENSFTNLFEITPNGLVPFINGVKLAAKKVYFGSISELTGDKLIVKAIATDNLQEIGLKSFVSKHNMVQSIVSVENPRKEGFQASSADCGEWPYVYEVTLPATFNLSDASPTEIVVAEEEGLNICHLIYTTNQREVIGYDIVINPTLEP